MQLFAIAVGGWGVDDRLADAVESAARAFPELADRPTDRFVARDGAVAVASVSHGPDMAPRRRYVYRRGGVVGLYDGLPISHRRGAPVEDAGELLALWPDIPDALTGIFSAVRVDLDAGVVECVLDALGLAQVFTHRSAGGHLLSNSLGALRRLTSVGEPDPLGVGSMLSLGFSVGGRTLLAGLDKLDGGCVHRFTSAGHETRPYLSPALVAPRRLREPAVTALADRLVVATAAAARGRPARCGLTAGRDSRVLLALTRRAGVEAEYFTTGVSEDRDVRAARELTGMLDVSHRLFTPTVPTDPNEWARMTGQFVAQTDGLASVSGIADWLEHQSWVDHVGVKLWGIGGEIGRAAIGLATPLAANAPVARHLVGPQRAVLARKLVAPGLVLPEAVAETRGYLDRFVDERLGEGWRAREVLEAFYAFVRVSAWAAPGVRRAAARNDVYSPFASRDFVEYAFSLSPAQRFLEVPHFELLGLLDAPLRDAPFDRPWRPQRPALAIPTLVRECAQATGKRRGASAATDRDGFAQFGHGWLEAGIDQVRERLLSEPASPLWGFVDRRVLEQVLTCSPEARRPRLEQLCRIATVHFALHDIEGDQRSDGPQGQHYGGRARPAATARPGSRRY